MSNDRPLISDIRTSAGNKPRGSMAPPLVIEAAPDAPPAEPLEALPTEATSEVKEDELSPAERYRKRLETAKIDLSEAHAIYDAVLDKGYYEEYVQIRKQRAVFRTRQYEDQLRLQTFLELNPPRTGMAHDEIVSRYNLAASLFEWRGKPLKHDTEDDFDTVLKLLQRMPQPVMALLYDKLAKFDYKVTLVFSDGCTDSF